MTNLGLPEQTPTSSADGRNSSPPKWAIAVACALNAVILVAVIILPLEASTRISGALLALFSGWIILKDARDYLIPDLGVLGIAVIGLAAAWGSADWLLALLSGVLSGGCLWALGWLVSKGTGRAALGFGDVKLATACGLVVGIFWLPAFFLCASILGLIHGLMARNILAQSKDDHAELNGWIPFGVYLSLAVTLIWLIRMTVESV
jgi:leader peptidase (prepilin peptidase) / N-methyltransferase